MSENEVLQATQGRIDNVVWFHDIDFPNGLQARTKTVDAGSHRKLWEWMRQELGKVSFVDKDVLEIGCWDGYWSFFAEQHGAKYVLASDDSTQNWSGSHGLALAKELLDSKVETRTDVSIYEAAKLGRTFDVVLCLGVYYHLIDPFYAFSQLRQCCHDKTVVIFEGDFAPDWFVTPKEAAFYEFGHAARCFVPTLFTLRKMLEANYFRVLCEAVYHGEKAQPVHRVMVTCQPFQGENSLHCTKPPFGLAQYDPRYR